MDRLDFNEMFKLKIFSIFSLSECERTEIFKENKSELQDSLDSRVLHLPVTVNQLIQTWDGIKLEKHNTITLNENQSLSTCVLMYNPWTGRTYNRLHIYHFKGISQDEVIPASCGMYNLSGLKNLIPKPEIKLIEGPNGCSNLLIVPFDPLSLFVNHDIENHKLWRPFLKSIGIPDGNRVGDLLNIVCYAIIDINSFISDHKSYYTQALICSGFSMSALHLSFRFHERNWYRFDFLQTISLDLMEACLDCHVEPHITCNSIEELDYGFAIVEKNLNDRVLLNTYNQIVLEGNTSERYFYYFQPKKINNEIYIIATRKIPTKREGPSYASINEWNIFRLSKSEWMFKKKYPKGLAFWKRDGSILILRRNIYFLYESLIGKSAQYLDFINEAGFNFGFVERVDFEDLLIGSCEKSIFEVRVEYVKNESFNNPFGDDEEEMINVEPVYKWERFREFLCGLIPEYYITLDETEELVMVDEPSNFVLLENVIESIPSYVISDIIFIRDMEEEYNEVIKGEIAYEKALDELNEQGWNEIKDFDPDWPYD